MMTSDARGFTLIELLVAVLIFTMLAAGLADTLGARPSRPAASSARWLRATQLADERLERFTGRRPRRGRGSAG
jgi:prepilin-type N-terminal cleavage/methylation domain-containing protein